MMKGEGKGGGNRRGKGRREGEEERREEGRDWVGRRGGGREFIELYVFN